jgi:hypothetical protein
MRRILPKLEFAAWFTHYLSPAGPREPNALARCERPHGLPDSPP